jgi:hypothetical protein
MASAAMPAADQESKAAATDKPVQFFIVILQII